MHGLLSTNENIARQDWQLSQRKLLQAYFKLECQFVCFTFQGKKRSSDILKKIEKGKYYIGERYLFNLSLSLKWTYSRIFFFLVS